MKLFFRIRPRKLGLLFAVALSALDCAAAEVTLAWDPSPDTNVVAYRVYYGTAAGAYGAMLQVPAPATTAVVGSLLSGASYFFAAKAVDQAGVESDFSNEASSSSAITNSAPTASALSVATVEDSAVNLLLSGADADGDALTFAVVTSPSNGTLSGTVPNLVYTPHANFLGVDQFLYSASDGAATATALVTINVAAVNDAPTLGTLPVGFMLVQNAASQTVVLTGLSPGAPNEAQPLTVSASSSNLRVVLKPTVTYVNGSSTATLIFTPALNGLGWSTITVSVNDGATTNNVTTKTFWVLLNTPPTLNPVSDMTVGGNAGEQTVSLSGITSGATNEFQPLMVTATSSNPTLIPHPIVSYSSPSSTGALKFTPAANRFGAATITVTVRDGQYGNNTVVRTFRVTVSPPVAISGLSAGATGLRTINIAWRTDLSATCVVEYGTTTMPDQVSATTVGTNHMVTLTNLSPGTVYYLRVKASAAGGVTTALATAATEAQSVLQWPAESGTFSGPMKIYTSASTENGKYVATSVKNKSGGATFNLNLLKGGNYKMWARVKTSPGGGVFSLSMNGGAEKAVFVGDAGAVDAWHWALVMDDMNRTNSLDILLQAGAQTLSVRGAVSAWWDEFIIVNDPLWQPLLPTTRPVLSATRNTIETATLTWSDPSGNATAASIEYSTDGVNYQWCGGVPAPGNTITVTNLAPGTYFFRVYSYNSVDRTAYSNVAAALYLLN